MDHPVYFFRFENVSLTSLIPCLSKDDTAKPYRSLRRPADSELERSRPRLVLSSGSMRRRLRPPEESSLIADSVPRGGGDVGDDEDPFPCYILQSGVYRWKGR